MKKLLLLVFATCLTTASFAQINWTNGGGTGFWNDDNNWDAGFYPDFPGDEAVFDGNVSSDNCIVSDNQTVGLFTAGVGGADYEGVLTVNSGFTLETTGSRWAAIGWTKKMTMVIESGATFKTTSHLWLAFNPGAKSFVELHGTIEVGQMFGVNFEAKGDANSEAKLKIHNGGHLKLAQLTGAAASPNNSFNGTIADGSVEVLAGGKITLPGDRTGDFNAYISAGKIITPGGNAVVAYDANEDLTTVSSDAPLSTESFTSFKFEAYPNPTSDVIYISTQKVISKVTVRNILGQSVLQEKNTKSLNISKLKAGYYFLSVEDEDGNVGTRKIVKK